MSERFVYYRIGAQAGAATVAAVCAAQSALCARHPGLQARLLRRADDGGGRTWMETYARPGHAGGVDDGLFADIERAMSAVLADAIDGARHVETFEPCAP